MNNTKAYYAVSEAVYWAMGRALDGAADETVSDAVYWAVNEAVDWAVNNAMAGAVEKTVHREPTSPALETFLGVLGCDPMNNTKAYYAVSGSVHGAVGRVVWRTVDWAVWRPMNRAVYGAVNRAGREDPDHPALEDFLLEAEAPVGGF